MDDIKLIGSVMAGCATRSLIVIIILVLLLLTACTHKDGTMPSCSSWECREGRCIGCRLN